MKKQPGGPAPREGGIADEMITERASATPTLAPTRKSRPRPAAPDLAKANRKQPPVMGTLRECQEWFATVIMDPGSVATGVGAAAKARLLGVAKPAEVERIITRGPQLSATERMNCYHYAYHARLVDCLTDDFPALRYALGQPTWEALAREVIAAYPSRRPNLNFYGRQLVRFCRERKSGKHRVFIAELAELEWAMVEVVHAQAAPVLSPDELKAIPLDRWGDVRFAPSQTVKVVTATHPVNGFLQAWRGDREPGIPKPAWSATAVYRRGYQLWRMDLDRHMAEILDQLFAGRTLGEALTSVAAGIATAEQPRLAQQLTVWFREWVAGGFFASLAH